MTIKQNFVWAVVLCTAAVCVAQGTPTATSSASTAGLATKHFRLTFVLTYPHSQQPSQSFSLDVPVVAGRPGVSIMRMASGSTGNTQPAAQQTIQCTDVHESASGLAANVSIAIDGEPTPPLPGSSEPIHHHLQFEKKIDVALDKSTVITEEMHFMKLDKGVATEAPMPASAATPQIAVTATEI